MKRHHVSISLLSLALLFCLLNESSGKAAKPQRLLAATLTPTPTPVATPRELSAKEKEAIWHAKISLWHQGLAQAQFKAALLALCQKYNITVDQFYAICIKWNTFRGVRYGYNVPGEISSGAAPTGTGNVAQSGSLPNAPGTGTGTGATAPTSSGSSSELDGLPSSSGSAAGLGALPRMVQGRYMN